MALSWPEGAFKRLARFGAALAAAALAAWVMACGSPTEPTCGITIPQSQMTNSVGAGASAFSLSFTGASGCSWSATASSGFLTITSGAAGSGSGTVQLAVAANTGAARTGTVTIAGIVVTVNQQAASQSGCAFNVSPSSATQVSIGGSVTITVSVTEGTNCVWSATTSDAFLTITGASSTGDGTVTVGVAANSGGLRLGTVAVAGQTVAISQAAADQAGCAFSVTPVNQPAHSYSEALTVTVTTTQGTNCAWTATTTDAFAVITSGSAGVGSGTVSLAILANTGGPRTASLLVAGQPVTISQEGAGCIFAVSPRTTTISSSGGSLTFAFSPFEGGPACPWTAAVLAGSSAAAVTGATSGTGAGSTSVSVAANTGTARDLFLKVAGQTVQIHQAELAGACVFAVSPLSFSLSAGAQTITITNTLTTGTEANCPFNVFTSSLTTIFTTQTSTTHVGNVWTYVFAVEANTGPARFETVTIGSQSVPVSQASNAPCAFSVSPSVISNVSGDQPGPGVVFRIPFINVSVTQGSNCAWTAVSQSPFISVTSGAAGVGNGTAQLLIDRNTTSTSPPRTGQVLVAGQTVQINQLGPVAVFSFHSDPGDPIGLGQSRSYTLQIPDFDGNLNLTTFASIVNNLRTPSGNWQLNLSATTDHTLAQGLYDGAVKYTGAQMANPGLHFNGGGHSCSVVSGRFIVGSQPTFNTTIPQQFHVVFEQHCDNNAALLTGDLWISGDGVTIVPPLSLPAGPSSLFSYLKFSPPASSAPSTKK